MNLITLRIGVAFADNLYNGVISYDIRFENHNFIVGDYIKYEVYCCGRKLKHNIDNCVFCVNFVDERITGVRYGVSLINLVKESEQFCL